MVDNSIAPPRESVNVGNATVVKIMIVLVGISRITVRMRDAVIVE